MPRRRATVASIRATVAAIPTHRPRLCLWPAGDAKVALRFVGGGFEVAEPGRCGRAVARGSSYCAEHEARSRLRVVR